MVEDSMATTIRYRPDVILNVVADTPELGQGDTVENPMPAPNARSTNVKAAAVTPPAMTAAQETAEGSFAVVLDATSALDASLMAECSAASPGGQRYDSVKVPVRDRRVRCSPLRQARGRDRSHPEL